MARNAGRAGGGLTVPGGMTLEAAMDILIPDLFEPMRGRLSPLELQRLKRLVMRYPWLVRFLTGMVVTGIEVGTDLLPLSDRVKAGGAQILEHLPLAFERYVTRLEVEIPAGFKDPSPTEAPDILWHFFRGLNVQVPRQLRELYDTVRRAFGSDDHHEGGHVVSAFLQLTPAQRANVAQRLQEVEAQVEAARTLAQAHPDNGAFRDALREADEMLHRARKLIEGADLAQLRSISRMTQAQFAQTLRVVRPKTEIRHLADVGLTGAVDGGNSLARIYREHRDEYEANHPEIAARRDRRNREREEFDARQEPGRRNAFGRFFRQLFTGRS